MVLLVLNRCALPGSPAKPPEGRRPGIPPARTRPSLPEMLLGVHRPGLSKIPCSAPECRTPGSSTFAAQHLRPIPFRHISIDSAWQKHCIVQLAQEIYHAPTNSRMADLADVLCENSCDNDEILHHCREPTSTFEAAGYWIYCWEQAIDSALGPILAVSRVLRERGLQRNKSLLRSRVRDKRGERDVGPHKVGHQVGPLMSAPSSLAHHLHSDRGRILWRAITCCRAV